MSDSTTSGPLTGPTNREYDPIDLFEHIVHRTNGDETAVLLTSFGDGYQVIAIDVDVDGQLLATEEVGSIDDGDRQTAEGMAEYWVQQNPKGILGASADEDTGGEGFLAKLAGMFGGE